MKRVLAFMSIFVVVMALLLSACGGNTPAPIAVEAPDTGETADDMNNVEMEEPTEEVEEPVEDPAPMIEVQDAFGETFVLEAPATRIVSLAPSITEVLFAIGAGDQVVGREEFVNFPEAALEVPSIGATYGELNTEAILALEPDLVMVAMITSPEHVQILEDLGLTVFMLPNPTTLDEMYDMLRTAAAITGHEEETEELIDSLKVRVTAVEEVIAGAETTPLVFYELDSTDPSAPYTTGPGTFIDTLITMAGGQNVAAGMEGAWVQMSSEEVISQNPEIILLGDALWGTTPEMVADRAGWGSITAVADGKVYPFNDDLASRPGPRLVDGLEEMARLFHPELFD